MTVQMPLIPAATQIAPGPETASPEAAASVASEFMAVLDDMTSQTGAIADVAAPADVAVPEGDQAPEDELLAIDIDEAASQDEIAEVVVDAPETPVVPLNTPAVPTPVKRPIQEAPPTAAPVALPTSGEDDGVLAPLPSRPAPITAPRATDPVLSVDDIIPPEEMEIALAAVVAPTAAPVETSRVAAPVVLPANALAAAAKFVERGKTKDRTAAPVVQQTPNAPLTAVPSAKDTPRVETLDPVATAAPSADQRAAIRSAMVIPTEPPVPAPKVGRSGHRAPEVSVTAPTAAPSGPITAPAILPITPAQVSPLAANTTREPVSAVDELMHTEPERLSSEGPVNHARTEQVSHLSGRPPISAPAFLRQIAVSIVDIGEGQTEIQLKPEELGRLRLSITSHSDTSVTVMMAAERGETTDLLRRHVADLERDLMALGYTSIEFDFGGGAEAGDSPEQTPFSEREPSPETPTAAAPTRRVTLNSGLDIRL